MKDKNQEDVGLVVIGSRAFTHNRFLLVLVGLTGIAWALAAAFGAPVSPNDSWGQKALAPQMIWAYLLLPIAGLGFALLRPAGFHTTARNCVLIAGAFLIGAALQTYLA